MIAKAASNVSVPEDPPLVVATDGELEGHVRYFSHWKAFLWCVRKHQWTVVKDSDVAKDYFSFDERTGIVIVGKAIFQFCAIVSKVRADCTSDEQDWSQ